MTFEVGKTYVSAKNLKGPKLRCLAKTPKGNFVLNDFEAVGDWCNVLPPQAYEYYVEYKEPKSGEFWVNVYEDGEVSTHWKTREGALAGISENRTYLCTKRVRWTEGDEE